MSPPEVRAAVSNGIPPPDLDLPYPDSAEVITSNILKLTELAPNPRVKFVFQNLVSKLHEFVNETRITPEEWMSAIEFLTRAGQTSTPFRQEFSQLSSVFGVTALVDALNNPPVGTATESSILGPFFTEDAPDVPLGESIASEGKGEYMYVEGYVRDTSGAPISGAVIETWETDSKGLYDVQYADRIVPDCRGRLVTDKDGKYGYRAVVPISYPIAIDRPAIELLTMLGRHNMRPSHLHMIVHAPGFRKLTTALFPEDDVYLSSDPAFGVKKSLVVKLKDIDDEAKARRRGFPSGSKFKLLSYDFTLLNDAEAAARRVERAK